MSTEGQPRTINSGDIAPDHTNIISSLGVVAITEHAPTLPGRDQMVTPDSGDMHDFERGHKRPVEPENRASWHARIRSWGE